MLGSVEMHAMFLSVENSMLEYKIWCQNKLEYIEEKCCYDIASILDMGCIYRIIPSNSCPMPL